MTQTPEKRALASEYEAAAVRPWTKLYEPTSEPGEAGSLTALDLFRTAPRDAAAVHYFDTTLTYGELDALADRLAGGLRERGVGRGDRVAVILQNTPQFLIATVAAWKLGAVVVSLNSMYRTPELQKLFGDCQPSAVICHDDQWSVIAPAASPLDPARVLWTSGRAFQTMRAFCPASARRRRSRHWRVLYAFPGVREAAGIGAPDPYRGETVIAVVSAKPEAVIDVGALALFCRERLAAYKCPADIRVVEDLPKSATGKITRNILRDDLRDPSGELTWTLPRANAAGNSPTAFKASWRSASIRTSGAIIRRPSGSAPGRPIRSSRS